MSNLNLGKNWFFIARDESGAMEKIGHVARHARWPIEQWF
jgi:hypothetical protein